ncbi:MAG TPA: 30S ribosomal protein S6 [Micavibrio sp.]|nr:30S ribosomal protein S6 [Pseudomonadota bacterium]HIF25976.1 30S ribosomal protein S6 [Micavibrio sp.]HIL28357.1 30S ribosomal protein S6 [Micavibrio sp.]
MPLYETVFIARQELSDAQVKTLTEDFCKIITDAKGKVHKTEFWGLKTLAYKINKARKAHYVLVELETPAEALLEVERQMRLSDDVLRYMSIKLEKLSDGPSIMMGGSRDTEEKEAA